MLPLVLEILHFRSDNRFQPIVEALSAIQEALTTRSRYFKAPVPIQGVVPRGWTEHVFEEVKGEAKVNRHYYELGSVATSQFYRLFGCECRCEEGLMEPM